MLRATGKIGDGLEEKELRCRHRRMRWKQKEGALISEITYRNFEGQLLTRQRSQNSARTCTIGIPIS